MSPYLTFVVSHQSLQFGLRNGRRSPRHNSARQRVRTKEALSVIGQHRAHVLLVEQIQKQKKGCSKAALFDRAVLLAVEHVHRDFKAKTHFGVFGFGPHGKAPLYRELIHQIVHRGRSSRPWIAFWVSPSHYPHKKTLKSDS